VPTSLAPHVILGAHRARERVKGRANKKHAISFAVRVKVEE